MSTIDTGALLGAVAGMFTVAGPVVVYLVRIESRITHIETLIQHVLLAKASPSK